MNYFELLVSFCLFLWRFHSVDAADRDYFYIKHDGTGQYLTKFGRGIPSVNEYSCFFDIITYPNETSIFYTQTKSVMGIKNGCKLNSKLTSSEFREMKSQYWYIRDDRSIGTQCDPDWTLTLTNSYQAVLKPMSKVNQSMSTWTIQNNTVLGFQRTGRRIIAITREGPLGLMAFQQPISDLAS